MGAPTYNLIPACLALALLQGACGDTTETAAPASGDVIISDATGTEPGPDTPTVPTGPGLLRFQEETGDDGLTCVTLCTVYLSYNEERTLQVLYTRDGEPVSGQVVKFAVEVEDPEGIGHISALSAYSDADGVASINVKPGQAVTGLFQVKAHVDEEGVEPLVYDVVVTPKKQVPLTVTTEYGGDRPVSTFEIRLYLQDGDGSPGCEDLGSLYSTQTAHQQSPPTTLGQSVKFLEFDGLEEAGTQVYTILVYALNPSASGVVLAWGCDGDRGIVTSEGSTSVRVPLLDRPPIYAGSYELTTLLDMSNAIPEPYGGAVNGLLDFFYSPSNGLLQLACDLGGTVPVLGELCGLVYVDDDGDQVSGIGSVIIDILDTVVQEMAAGTVWGDVLIGGAEISEMITALEFHTTLIFATEPDAGGHWSPEHATSTWDGVTVKWSLGQACDPITDDGCGLTNLYFSSIQGEAVTGAFEATVEDFWHLTISPHPLNLHYGALLDAVMQKVLLPLLAGDGTDGLPAIDTYEKLLKSVVGGKDCLLPDSPGCCAELIESVQAQDAVPIGEQTAEILTTACDSLIAYGAEYLSGLLVDLTADSDDSWTLSTAEPCAMYDTDGDMVVDGMGSVADPCQWIILVGDGEESSPMEAIFWGVRAN